ncbi:MAG: Gfo/Idh/MocA family protein, partial [Planctomycetota bacterium]
IASDVDVVLLATPPHFRPMHLRACIEAGKHVFAEKPVAVDAPGVRSVLETTKLAKQKNLFIVSGLNGRYSPPLQEIVLRVQNGAIGKILALHAARYGGGVWVRPRESGMTDMEYQMRNWYYFIRASTRPHGLDHERSVPGPLLQHGRAPIAYRPRPRPHLRPFQLGVRISSGCARVHDHASPARLHQRVAGHCDGHQRGR